MKRNNAQQKQTAVLRVNDNNDIKGLLDIKHARRFCPKISSAKHDRRGGQPIAAYEFTIRLLKFIF